MSEGEKSRREPTHQGIDLGVARWCFAQHLGGADGVAMHGGHGRAWLLESQPLDGY
jgi:hypothetical protein